MRLHEGPHQRREQEIGGGQADPEPAARLPRGARQLGAGRLHPTQHPAAALQEQFAALGERDGARGAMEQPGAELLLQALDRLADRGRRQAHELPCGLEAALVGGVHEGLQGADAVHGRGPGGTTLRDDASVRPLWRWDGGLHPWLKKTDMHIPTSRSKITRSLRLGALASAARAHRWCSSPATRRRGGPTPGSCPRSPATSR